MAEYVHRLELDGRVVTLTWVGQTGAIPTRVHALAFTPTNGILLVSDGPDDPDRWLPGGGVEDGETPEEALRRELMEEAGAVIEALEYLGSQRMDDPEGRQEYHRFYWCRAALEPQDRIRLERTTRHVVSPEDFLDSLRWGRTDPAAPLLLDLALKTELRYERLIG